MRSNRKIAAKTIGLILTLIITRSTWLAVSRPPPQEMSYTFYERGWGDGEHAGALTISYPVLFNWIMDPELISKVYLWISVSELLEPQGMNTEPQAMNTEVTAEFIGERIIALKRTTSRSYDNSLQALETIEYKFIDIERSELLDTSAILRPPFPEELLDNIPRSTIEGAVTLLNLRYQLIDMPTSSPDHLAIQSEGLLLVWNTGVLGPRAVGVVEISVPWHQVKALLADYYKFLAETQ